MSTSPDLDGWVERARTGDVDAFAAVYRSLHPPLLRYLRVAAEGQHEDLAAQVWLEVTERLPRFRGDGEDFRGWLFTLARRRTIDAHRRRARRPVQVDTQALAAMAAPGGVDEDVLEALDTHRALASIAQLPPEQAQVVALRVIAGLDVDQVAAALGKSPGAVRVLCHRGLRRLAACWERPTVVPAVDAR